MAGIPAAPKENAGTGNPILFLTEDDLSSALRAVLLKSYQSGLVNGQRLGDLGVYPTSGKPKTGYMVTTGSTEIAISASSIPCQGVIVKADPDNTEDIWVGATGITVNKTNATEGYRLSPGESVGIPCRNVNTVFVRRGASSNMGVYWTASID